MAYTKLFYHLVWSTKYRKPIISPKIEDHLHGYIAKKAIRLGGIIYAINGIEDHIHLAASIPPKVAVASFIGQIKAVSSVRINQTAKLDSPFRWQSGYAAFTFRESGLSTIIHYIDNQKQHHSKGTTKEELERLDDDKNSLLQQAENYCPGIHARE